MRHPNSTMSRAFRLLPVVALAALASACLDSGTGPQDTGIHVHGIRSDGPIHRTFAAALEAAAGIEVYYEPLDGGRAFRIRSDSAAESHELLLPRLLPDTTYRVAARVIGGGTGNVLRDTFSTGPLPDDLQDIDYSVEGEATFPLLLMNHEVEGGFAGIIGMEPDGRIVWYAEEPGVSQAATPVPGSHDLVVVSRSLQAVVRVTPGGKVVASLDRRTLPEGGIHHDIAALDGDRVAMIARERRTVGDTVVNGEAVWEWNTSTGEVRKLWSAWDHFDWNTDRGPRSTEDDWLHANALSVGPRGNLILSLHYLDQVVSIAPDHGSLEWRLGGVNPTIAVAPADQFSGQHSAFELPGGRVLLFDNNYVDAFSGGHSRGLELEIQGDSAVSVWEYVASPPITAPIWSGIYPLENGHRVVTFSIPEVVRPPEVTDPFVVDEVDGNGLRVWRLTGPGLTVSFRGVPWTSIAGEERVDAMP